MAKKEEKSATDREVENFCVNILRIRRWVGLSQKQMAAIMGISVGSLRKIERGTMPPRMGVDAICNLCVAFHIPPRVLFGELEWDRFAGG